MNQPSNIVIIGATSSIASQCGRIWAKSDPASMVLVGRDKDKLNRVRDDLAARSPKTVFDVILADFIDPNQIQKTVDEIYSDRPVDLVLIAHGSLPNQQDCQQDLNLCSEALTLNGVSPLLFAEAFAQKMVPNGQGTIAVIGSVAGDRGRKTNYVYGAAKGMLERYTQGMQHRLAGSGVNVVLIKPGPTDTPMTAGLKNSKMKLAPVDEVAGQIVQSINDSDLVCYTPKKWRAIMFVVRSLPHAIFKRINL